MQCTSSPLEIPEDDGGSEGSAHAVHTGTKYGPECGDFNFGQVTGAQGISIEYMDNLPKVNQQGFRITYDSDQDGGVALDRVYFKFRFSLPLNKEDIKVCFE